MLRLTTSLPVSLLGYKSQQSPLAGSKCYMAQAQTQAYSKYRVLESARSPAAEGQCLDRPSLSHPHGLEMLN